MRAPSVRTWRRRVQFGLIVLALGVVLRCSVADLGRVAGGSMRPTLRGGDYILTNKLAYGFRVPFTDFWPLRWAEPQPGDVVVLTSPVDGRRLVKRIAAGPGDALGNGRASGSTVPPGKYFVKGDDADSVDSRTFGCVPRDQILGRVVGVVHPFDFSPTVAHASGSDGLHKMETAPASARPVAKGATMMARQSGRRFGSLLLACGLAALSWPGGARGDLLDYVKKPEPHFAWKLKQKTDNVFGTIYDLELTSQTWEGVDWTHSLQVYQPKGVAPTDVMLLYNTGGKPNEGTIAYGMIVAKKVGAPCAFLYDIPNQPLLGGKKEDALIAETFVRYLDTKDNDWPLLFPMTKSLVKAMDALQAFSKEEWKAEVKGFVVSGASKRGWTTWLTGAADPRVRAIAPMVIDTLNMVEQMKHQKETLGRYSDMIHDYTERGLVPIPDTDAARQLWRMIDPYFYRARLTMPKLIICGANDQYWSTDALNLYWDDLPGDKWITYVPNAGHKLEQGGGGDEPGDRSVAVNALAAFARAQVTGKAFPKLAWKHDDDAGRMRLTVTAKPAPTAARLWVAKAPTRDFRNAKWEERPATIDKETVTGEVEAPTDGCTAFFGDLDYEIDGIKYHLCTQMRVAGTAKP